MAFSLPLKSPVSPNTLPIVTRPMAMKPSASRLFNTNRFQTARLSSDVVFGPFSPTWTASQVHPSLTKRFRCASRGTGGGGGGKRCRSWGAKHTEDAVELRFELPWLGEEDVRVRVYEDLLMIRDVSVEESEDDEETAEPEMKVRVPKLFVFFHFPKKDYKTDQFKAEMKNGVLKVVVPKIKEEERIDAILGPN
ncbi:hypothetical protein PTKIN_Ptkin04bG0011200 [Pterospermum kingtungense]